MRFPYRVQVASNVTVNTNGQVIGTAFPNPARGGMKPVLVAYLKIANAPTGTTPTMVVNVQGSSDGTNWATVGSFPSQNASSGTNVAIRLSLLDVIDPNLQITATLTGTTPVFSGVSVDVYVSTEE